MAFSKWKNQGKESSASIVFPGSEQLENELEREKGKLRFRWSVYGMMRMITVTSAIVVLCAFLIFPIFRIYGSSMSPTVNEGEIVVSFKGSTFKSGDVVVLSYNGKPLVKRVIAGPGEWVDIDAEGNVYVNERQLYEPYLTEKAFGDCNIALPYQVPDGRYFVMGDNRSTSQDSRSKAMGCIAKDKIVGKAVMRIWPLDAVSMLTGK